MQEEHQPRVLWKLQFAQTVRDNTLEESTEVNLESAASTHTLSFSASTGDLSFDDGILREVRSMWQRITGNEDGFMHFEDREAGAYEDEDG